MWTQTADALRGAAARFFVFGTEAKAECDGELVSVFTAYHHPPWLPLIGQKGSGFVCDEEDAGSFLRASRQTRVHGR